ncbi:phosphate-starvation-inducible PsiE family protein [Cellvibrio sp. PSBB006]|uniref:phosphate-starvation-inducible PsiE family protein n=1 Tax=Cellvibrio sp. PSBB006 TaxID=1987723 RepID=UPI001E3BDFFA|nr:phosphate-starvation-inducible PsiE family protein [Cellvibrio sp. PSBB006]
MSLIIRYVAKTTAVIMVFVIIWGVADIVYVLYQRLKEPPFLLLEINDILATFGAFMAVLIAIEIYHNLVLYVQDNHNSRLAVEIVLATALMAAARKVIVFDYNEMAYHYVYATGAVILALSIAYYYIVVVSQKHAK